MQRLLGAPQNLSEVVIGIATFLNPIAEHLDTLAGITERALDLMKAEKREAGA